jgi:hypothetical protein
VLQLRLEEIATAKNECNRGENVEPDRRPLAPVLGVRDEVRGEENESANRGDEERNGALHAGRPLM